MALHNQHGQQVKLQGKNPKDFENDPNVDIDWATD
jgi:hypothetical protein